MTFTNHMGVIRQQKPHAQKLFSLKHSHALQTSMELSPLLLKSCSINTCLQQGAEETKLSALLTLQHLFPSYSPSLGDQRQEQWVGNSSRLSLMLPCSPSDSVLMRSLFLSISLLHQLPRVPALLRGHPSKLLTQALQHLVAARWYIICRVAKGTMITRTAVDVTFFSIEKPKLQAPRLSLHSSLKNGQKWHSNPRLQERL